MRTKVLRQSQLQGIDFGSLVNTVSNVATVATGVVNTATNVINSYKTPTSSGGTVDPGGSLGWIQTFLSGMNANNSTANQTAVKQEDNTALYIGGAVVVTGLLGFVLLSKNKK